MASKYAQEKGISAEDGSWQKNIKQGVLDKLAEYEGQIKTLEGELVRERNNKETGDQGNANKTAKRSYKIDTNSPVYHGRVDEDLDEWIIVMNSNCDAINVPDNMRIHSVTNYLADGAKKELIAYMKKQNLAKKEKSFKEFCLILAKKDDPEVRINLAKAKLDKIRQTKSFDEYVNEFRKLSIDLILGD